MIRDPVFFTLLSASNYNYSKGTLKADFFLFKIIHVDSELLRSTVNICYGASSKKIVFITAKNT